MRLAGGAGTTDREEIVTIGFSTAAFLAVIGAGLVAAPLSAAQEPAPSGAVSARAMQQGAATITVRGVHFAQASGAECKRQCTRARAACTARQESRYQPTAICQSEYNKCVAACN